MRRDCIVSRSDPIYRLIRNMAPVRLLVGSYTANLGQLAILGNSKSGRAGLRPTASRGRERWRHRMSFSEATWLTVKLFDNSKIIDN